MTAEQLAFIAWLAPLAQKYARPTPTDKLILPSLTIAQGIVESAWGTSVLAVNGHNYFGIKANSEWSGPSINKLTGEVINGQAVKVYANFRAYPDRETGVADHRAFLLRAHYAPVWDQTDYRLACKAVKAAGYATALDYAENLIDKIERYDLARFDQPFIEEAPVKIFLSPSSQENNLYAVGGTTEEKVCNLIADALEPILVKHGIAVMQNNPADGPAGHTAKSNAWKPDYHIPIHTNAGGARGCEVFCWNASNSTAKGTIMARNIYAEIAAITPTGDRGVKTNQTFYEIKNTSAPVAYIEVEYHDSKEGAAWILANIKPIAEAIARGILKTVGITYVDEKLPVIKKGAAGIYVKKLQETLNSFGYTLAITSNFDTCTEAAVVHFQWSRKLDVDGVVGSVTWSALDA